MRKAISRFLAPGWRRWIADLGFGIWDLDGKTWGLRAAGMVILQRGVLHNGNFATRGAKLGFRIIGPPGGEGSLQKRKEESGKRTRKRGERARGRC